LAWKGEKKFLGGSHDGQMSGVGAWAEEFAGKRIAVSGRLGGGDDTRDVGGKE
jgi:hypothetical protein